MGFQEGNYGYLERMAFWSFTLGMAGMILTVVASKFLDDPADALWVMAVWFSPIPFCVLCWWSVASKDDLGNVCILISIICGVGALSGEPASLLFIPFLIIVSLGLAALHPFARRILNRGRKDYRKL